MAIRLACKCGKKFQTQDKFAGMNTTCPSCGVSLVIPATHEESAPPARTDRFRESVEVASVDDRADERETLEEDKKSKPKKRKKPKRRNDGETPAIEIFGVRMSPLKGIATLCLLGLVGFAVYFLWPSGSCQVVETRRVDAFAALDVAEPKMMKQMLGVEGKDFLSAGGDKWLIVRDSPNGEFLFLRLKLPPRFLQRKAKIVAGTVMLDVADFQLQGEGAAVTPLFLNNEAPLPDTDQGVTMIFPPETPEPALPRERKPWTHEGTFEGDPVKKEIKLKGNEPLLDNEKDVAFLSGTARFKGKRGMEVNYNYEGLGVHLTWDAKSKGYLATIHMEYIDRFAIESLMVECVFPRPAGNKLKLTVFGESAGTIRAE
jgi:hypothetical protein